MHLEELLYSDLEATEIVRRVARVDVLGEVRLKWIVRKK